MAPSFLLLLLVAALAAGARATNSEQPSEQPVSGAGRQYFSLLSCLETNYPALTKLILEQGLERAIWDELKVGKSVTIMAPSDRAIEGYSPDCPGGAPDLKSTLLQHVIKGKVTKMKFQYLGIRSKFETYGPKVLTKLLTEPPLVGVTNGTKTLSFARIMDPQICWTQDTMVHGINRVLYSCPGEDSSEGEGSSDGEGDSEELKQISALFDEWNSALQTGDPAKVAAMYAADSVLLPTVSNTPRLDYDSKVDYFTKFLESKPYGTINEPNVRFLTEEKDVAINSGIYTFKLTRDGKEVTVPARYTFVYAKDDSGEWKIVEHHSSAMPEPMTR